MKHLSQQERQVALQARAVLEAQERTGAEAASQPNIYHPTDGEKKGKQGCRHCQEGRLGWQEQPWGGVTFPAPSLRPESRVHRKPCFQALH